MAKERFQNPNVGDTVRLRLLVMNNHTMKDVDSIEKVEIWRLDPDDPSDCEKRELVTEIDGASVQKQSEGNYYVDLLLEDPVYIVGRYIDIWYINFEAYESELGETAPNEQYFEVVRDLWMTSSAPMVFDFSFRFQPNKIVQGSKQYLIVQVRPNVPKASTYEEYYQNLAVTSPIRISIQQRCGECLPPEEDLRLIVDEELVEWREKNLAYYFLDTTEMDPGIYDVWFQMDFAESSFISPKGQLQIFE